MGRYGIFPIRDGLVLFTADIESMFHQVGVPLQHQSCLRFLWWSNGDLNAECQTYQMKVHIFFSFLMHVCPGALTTHAESNNSDLQRKLDRRLRHIQH